MTILENKHFNYFTFYNLNPIKIHCYTKYNFIFFYAFKHLKIYIYTCTYKILDF